MHLNNTITVTQDNTLNPDMSDCKASGLSLLDHLGAQATRRCRNPQAPIIFGRDVENKKALALRAPCKMWNCESCGARKTKYWVARVVNGVNIIGGQWYFITLTAHEHHRREKSLPNLREGWGKLHRRIRRKYGKFDYVKVWEQHIETTYHMHLIANLALPYTTELTDEKSIYRCRYLKDTARACGLGYMTDYQPLESVAGAAFYTAKYLSKSLGDAGISWAKNLRRIQPSQGFPELPDLTEDSDLTWEYVTSSGHLYLKADKAIRDGFKVYGGDVPMESTPKKLAKWYKNKKGES